MVLSCWCRTWTDAFNCGDLRTNLGLFHSVAQFIVQQEPRWGGNISRLILAESRDPQSFEQSTFSQRNADLWSALLANNLVIRLLYLQSYNRRCECFSDYCSTFHPIFWCWWLFNTSLICVCLVFLMLFIRYCAELFIPRAAGFILKTDWGWIY